VAGTPNFCIKNPLSLNSCAIQKQNSAHQPTTLVAKPPHVSRETLSPQS
jgi:hypothetical protein